MQIKFYWWIFVILVFVSAIVPDVDHFIISTDNGFPTITNWRCMWDGFAGNSEFYDCQQKETNHGRFFHHPYFWAIIIGLTIGGLTRKWALDYNMQQQH